MSLFKKLVIPQMTLKIILTMLLACILNRPSFASSKEVQKEKMGILLVSFGTSYADAQRAFDHIELQVKQAFPDIKIQWAFTSNIIRHILEKRGQLVDTPAEALARMDAEGYTKIAVQSLHIIPGEEFEVLEKTVDVFNHLPTKGLKIRLGVPLLYNHNDIVETCAALKNILPRERAINDGIVFMGHGTSHPSNIYYPGVQYYLWKQSPLFFMSTVEGYPGISDVILNLKKQKVKTVWLIPFMSVAGEHANNDIAGDGSNSWKSQLETAGFTVKPVLKGLAEYDAINNIWINHLKKVIDELKE